MEVIVKACPTCGSTKLSSIDTNKAQCEHCGNIVEITNNYSEYVNNLLSQGRIMLNALDFKLAKTYYEEALKLDNTLHEAYFGAFISDYGIEYVKDPQTNKYLPTCHKTSTISVYDNYFLQKAINNSQGSTKEKYLTLASEYEKIRALIITKSNEFEDYDIFICYKSKNENGTFTKEHDFAIELYYELKNKENKVFFADITLQKYAGEEYEAIIYKALTSARFMIIVAFDDKNLNSPWVKNEWSRFLELKNYDDDKKLVLLYKDISPYDLPLELKGLQALDTNRYSYIDTLREILDTKSIKVEFERKPINKEEINFNEILPNKITKNKINVDKEIPRNLSNLENAQSFLSRGSFNTAERFYHLAIKESPKAGNIYFGLLMSLIQARTNEEIPQNIQKLEDTSIIVKAIQYSDELTSLEYINVFVSAVVEKVNTKEDKIALKLFNELIHWVTDEVADYLSKLIFKLAYDMVSTKKTKDAIKVFECSLKTLSQDEILIYLDRHYLFAEKLRKNKKFIEAKYINRRILKVNNNLVKGRFGLLLSSYNISDDKKIYRCFDSNRAFRRLEAILEKEYDADITSLLFKSTLYAIEHRKIKTAIKLFDTIIQYIPIECDDIYINYIWTFGNKLLAKRHFEFALKYFQEITNLQPNNSRAYMAKVMCRCKVNDVDKLAYSKIDYTRDRDFHKALICSDEYAKSYNKMRRKAKFI